MTSHAAANRSKTSGAADLQAFERLAWSRRSVRNFLPDPVPEDLLVRLLEAARWAPSGYNLQPTHMVVVADPSLKPDLCRACMGQRQILEAPVTVVFTGDRDAAERNLEPMIAAERAVGALDDGYERVLRKYVQLGFGRGPLGLGWLWKAVLAPLAALGAPVPSIPAIHKRYWLAKQVSLSVMVFMLAAHAAGLATVPMEGFDEGRVRKLLGIPRRHIVPIVVPVGYARDVGLKKSRLPLDYFVHRNRW
jgi:nitroreductase